jgi:hypothetical protein
MRVLFSTTAGMPIVEQLAGERSEGALGNE